MLHAISIIIIIIIIIINKNFKLTILLFKDMFRLRWNERFEMLKNYVMLHSYEI